MLRLILLATLTSAVLGTATDPCDLEDANGCSSPIQFSFEKEFTPSCNRHDICYSCAVSYEFNRKDCDIAFLRDMVTECKRISFENAESAKDLESRGTVKDQLARVKRCKRVSATIGDDQGQDCDSNDSKYLECISTADVVYAVVRLFGGSHFSTNSEGYCQKPFVRGCLPN